MGRTTPIPANDVSTAPDRHEMPSDPPVQERSLLASVLDVTPPAGLAQPQGHTLPLIVPTADPAPGKPRPLDAEKREHTVLPKAGAVPKPARHDVVFNEANIDPDVQKVLRRLVRHGHQAYLVG